MSTGHSLVLRGYSQFVGGEMTYSYMDPALATIRSIDIPISAQNNGSNVGILCSGRVMYWYQSVKDMQ